MVPSANRMRKIGRKDERVRKALAELLNLTNDPAGYEAGSRFIEKYGELSDPRKPTSSMPEADAVEYARRLRDVWSADTREEIQRANAALNEMFKAGDPINNEGPAVTADLRARRVIPKPRTFLHELALELLHFPRSIGRCKWCEKFFVKVYSRDGFCPPTFNPDGAKLADHEQDYRNRRQKLLMRKRRGTSHAKRSNRKD